MGGGGVGDRVGWPRARSNRPKKATKSATGRRADGSFHSRNGRIADERIRTAGMRQELGLQISSLGGGRKPVLGYSTKRSVEWPKFSLSQATIHVLTPD